MNGRWASYQLASGTATDEACAGAFEVNGATALEGTILRVRSQKSGFIFVAGLIAVLGTALPRDSAQGAQVFTVANYPVEATADNAVAAKTKAHSDGQQAALGALLKRLVPVTAYNRLERLLAFRAADFIDGVAVRSERNSRTRYIASLDFAFRPDAVRDLLHREGVPYVEQQAPRMVLVPVLVQPGGGEGARYRPAAGSWSDVWQGLDLDNTLTPLKIEALKPAINDDTIAAALAGQDVERVLADAYNVDFVLLAVAEVDQPSGKLNVTIGGVDPAGLMTWRRAYHIDGGDVGYAMEMAAVVTQGVLEGRWKVARLESSGQTAGFGSTGVYGYGSGGGTDVHMSVQFMNQAEWDDVRGRLLSLPGVENIRIGSVSAQRADVSLSYPGGGQSLAPVLAREGLLLTDGGGGYWALRAAY